MKYLHACVISLLLSSNLVQAASQQARTYRFQTQTTRVGDVSEQSINYRLNIELAIQQAGQTIDAKGRDMNRQQRRRLEVLEVAANGVPVRGKLSYPQSKTSFQLGKEKAAQTEADCVSGKSYLITRMSDQLLVTDLQGETPSVEEVQTVRTNMSAFGLQNPLSAFFNGRAIRVGQTVKMPDEQAREMLGFGTSVGSVSDFVLRLAEARNVDGKDYAVFEMSLNAVSPDTSSLKMKLKGQIVMQVDGCRIVSMRMSGPVDASEDHGPANAQFQVVTRGEMRLSLNSKHVRIR